MNLTYEQKKNLDSMYQVIVNEWDRVYEGTPPPLFYDDFLSFCQVHAKNDTPASVLPEHILTFMVLWRRMYEGFESAHAHIHQEQTKGVDQ